MYNYEINRYIMFSITNLVNRKFTLFIISIFIFLSNFVNVYAEDINWVEIANSNNAIQYIDSSSIKYNNRGMLSVVTKYSEVNSDNHQILNSNSYLMAVDCENRLFSKLPLNGELNQVKVWEKPTNDKLIKKTILSSCTY